MTWPRQTGTVLLVLYAGALAAVIRQSYNYPLFRFHNSGWIWLLVLLGLAVVAWYYRQPIPRGLWWAAAGLVALASLSFPDTSRDYWRYLFDGELIRLWHLSPYDHLPGAFAGDQYVSQMHGIWWTRQGSPYGPLWQALMAAINWASANQAWAGIVWLKLVNAAALALAVRQIRRLAGADWPAWLLVLNPVILLNSVATPHTDLLIAALVLTMVEQLRRPISSGWWLAAAMLIKPHVALMLPLLIDRSAAGWRRWRRVLAAVGGGLTGLVLLWPVGRWNWAAMLQAQLAGGLGAHDSLLWRWLWPGASSQQLAIASAATAGLIVGVVIWAWWKQRCTTLTALAGLSLVVPLTLTGLLLPWHFILPLAALAAMPTRWAWLIIAFITATVLRSAVTVPELLTVAGCVGLAGVGLQLAWRNLSDRPAWLVWRRGH